MKKKKKIIKAPKQLEAMKKVRKAMPPPKRIIESKRKKIKEAIEFVAQTEMDDDYDRSVEGRDGGYASHYSDPIPYSPYD